MSEKEKYLEAILEHTVDGLITIDENGTVETFNKACESMFGYKADEVIGRDVKMLMPEPYHSEHDTYLDNYKRTGEKKIIGIGREVEAQRKNGSIFPIDLAVSQIKIAERVVYSGIIRDITARKEAEEELKSTIQELTEANKELENFAYIASHDLKSPMRGIDNLAQWITEDLTDVINDDTRQKLKLLRSRVNRLEMLLDDILEYSRAGRIVDQPEEVDIGELIYEISDTLHLPDGFSITIPDDLPVVFSVHTPLRQIFLNLITNAYKHHDKEKGCIEILYEDRGLYGEFTVKDDGPGIPEKFHERVFEMFQTLKSRDKTEGTGLGLAIIKKLVGWQEGKVWIVSKDGKRGTEMRFLWPKTYRKARMNYDRKTSQRAVG